MRASHHRIVIIGAGFAGIGLGVRLLQAGIEDFVILERNESVGGTWFEHTYPGCACDIPTHLYSYSFARNPHWTRLFPPQREILAYVRRVADDYGVTPHIRLGCEMEHSDWDELALQWRLSTSRGELSADVIVSAIGATAEPAEPELPGLDSFAGQRFHSARWDHQHELRGERVAVIGTGPAAAQFVPEIQPRVAKLVLFQRTPSWVVPHPDRAVPWVERQLLRLFPVAQDVQRNVIFAIHEAIGMGFRGRTELIAPIEAIGRAHLRRQVADPVLRRKLTPHYRFGCKRPILSNTFYPALSQPNVELVTDRIERLEPDAIVTTDGRRREVDTIISATGYRYNRSLLVDRVSGVGGGTLGSVWNGSPRAYLGSAVPGFPNMFILLGPNAIGINSVIFTLESQINYVMSALAEMERRSIRRIEVLPEALRSYIGEVDRRSAGSVWTDGGCKAYYTDDEGRNYALYPGFAAEFRRRTRRFELEPYEVRTASDVYGGGRRRTADGSYDGGGRRAVDGSYDGGGRRDASRSSGASRS
jgi:cation diffusion facilitator CzcD-associated flavoprotein CzcO